MPSKRERKEERARRRARTFTLWLEFEVLSGFDQDEDFCNIVVYTSTGEKYALNIWTFRYFARALADSQRQGSNADGRYLLAPDLFVARLDRPTIEAAIADLIRTDGMRPEWLAPDDSDDEADPGDPQRAAQDFTRC